MKSGIYYSNEEKNREISLVSDMDVENVLKYASPRSENDVNLL